MVRATLNQTSFTGGEISPRAIGRTDIDRYGTAVKRARNCHPVITGGLKMREGTLHVGEAYAGSRESILIPFVKGRDEAWMLEFSDQRFRVYSAAGAYLGIEVSTVYPISALTTLDWAQNGSTMYLFHPDYPVYRLQLIGTSWVISAAPFTTQPFDETGIINPAVSVTLSLATVGAGRTATASGAFFLAADVGRAIVSDVGIAVITGYTSTTVVTVEITRAFSATLLSAWTLEGSPQTDITPSAKDPEGAAITLTAGAAAWRTTDVGARVRLNGGLVRVSGFTSTTVVTAVIERELTSTVAAPALAWSIEYPVWTSANGYPRTGTFHQQRLICAGSEKFPMTVWGSRIAEPLDFGRWTNDDDSFTFTIESDEASPIVYVTSVRDLVVLTESGEYSMRSGVEKPITPTNVRVVPEKNHGTAQVRPVQVGDETLFVQRAGRKVRSLGWRYEFDSYKAPDLTALADHITKTGIISMAFQQEPDLLLWAVREDGKFMTCLIDRDQQPSVIGWALHETQGFVEWVASIPNGDRDDVWVIVRRTIDGVTRIFIERFDGSFVPIHPSVATDDSPVYGCTVDCGFIVDNAAGQDTFTLGFIPDTTVTVVADGSAMGEFTTNGAGSFTLPRTSKRTLIGLAFESEGTLLTPELGTGEGSAQGNSAKTGEITMRFLDTIGAKVVDAEGSEQTVAFRGFGENVLDAPPQPFTGLHRISKLGWQRGAAELSVVQRQPLPWHLLGVIRKHTVNS